GGEKFFFFLLEMPLHRGLELLELPLAAGGITRLGRFFDNSKIFIATTVFGCEKFSDSHDVFPHSMQKIQKISNYFVSSETPVP
ncbi:MAG: hypothetical protein WBQ05_13880, partial [Candidatus Competibacter denitrificans]